MIVVGIDPGYESLGYAFLEVNQDDRNVFKALDFGVITTKSSMPYLERLFVLDNDLRQLLDFYCQKGKDLEQKRHGAVEKLYFAKNTTTALKVSEARGIVLLNLYRYDILVREYYPSQMKKLITGNGMASKDTVMQMLPRLISNVNIPPNDDNAADALAMALSCAFSLDFPQERLNDLQVTF